jgi:signal transduction histidine kinase
VDPAADSLPDDLRTCVYRVIQEALTNAGRHSAARRVHVKLHATDAWVVGTIADDGRGFDPEAPDRRGLGLLGMEERVKELGGSISVISSPGLGTTVEFRLPRPAATEVSDDSNPDSRRSRDRSDRIEAPARAHS